ncbi:MAG: 3-mercaptopyruvate sulfurtransferase [Alphaproteobacteria bacterium]|nr:3-mercaptopyruvate sulfurtransferase [Alphaproteobacteria bacterium]
MPDLRGRYIVETDWLAEHLDAPDLILLDGSTHLPTSGRNAEAEYNNEHIPGALFFDINAVADQSNPLPHMLPPPVQFSSMMKKMGIGDGMRVIVYDSEGLYSAGRVWWMFRTMGHEDVAVLDGGLRQWKAENRPTTNEPPPKRTERHFTARFNAALVRDLDDVKGIVASGSEQIIDARAAARFRGEVAEPRKGLRSGHMPGAINIPFPTLLNDDGTLKSAEELKEVFASAGVNLQKPVTASCGSGVTAGVIALALALIGHPDTAVYDGSWSEWGHEDAGTTVVTD